MNGLVDIEDREKHPDEQVRALAQREVEQSNRIRLRMSPPGGLRLPKLLDERRLQFGIVDGAFRTQVTFERVFVWQIPRVETETFEGTRIIAPQNTRKRLEREASRGVLVGAGLSALDRLRSNGIELGHIVQIIRNAPWRIQVDSIAGQDFHVIVLQAGDLLGSEDLAAELLAGKAEVKEELNEHGVGEHVIVRDGVFRKPIEPWMDGSI
jgi:hypothetical protein